MRTHPWLIVPALSVALSALVRADAFEADGARADAAQGFAKDNAEAMDRMMKAMSNASTGDPDRDFVLTMVPHHQGAIDMALAELGHGKDETLRRMAQEIIVEQRQEIEAMQLAEARLRPAGARKTPSADVCTGRARSQPAHDPVPPERN